MTRGETIRVAGLLVVGLTQMVAQLAELPGPRAIAAATNASPAPKVFSAVQGLETYSTAFHLDWTGPDGSRHSRRITSEMYTGLDGPYNRRNVYGAVFAFGPVLAANPATAPMFQSVLRSALCGERPILRELGLDPEIMSAVRVRLVPLRPEALGNLVTRFEPDCR